MTKMVDMRGNTFHVGCKVVRAVGSTTPYLNICTVTKIDGSRMYLDNSHQPLRFPERLLIIEQDPLYKMVKNYESNS